MPNYLYKHPETEEVKEVFQKMNDEHTYFEEGVEWKRVWTVPQAAIDSNVDVFSERDFMKKTEKSGTIGDLWDRSKEWSDKRADKIGDKDPIKQKAFKEYSAKRKGKKHEHDK
jgi:hypothetical protein